ncbi:MAG TPA: hypothetical protein DCR93_01375, partial [Cytophagales bacterium]|nr:hypothetical protein [Cytophagales bacterium]
MQKDIFEFTGNAKKNLLIAAGVGVVLIILGALTFKPAEGSGHGEDGHGDSHASVETTDQKIGQMVAYQEDEHQEGDGHAEEEDHGDSEEGDHHDDDQTDAAHAEPGDGHHEEAEQ